ncbi:MAG: response regulator transcription factor [Rhodospirillales bacterium]|nr:MAG: response regulator transcription factor [Rhodospirillales bacterium]
MAKILVVDDDRHIRDVVAFALRKDGFTTVEAADGAAALDAAARERPDLVILDVMMPELDGAEVCRRLRAGSTVPIIFLSSKDDEIDRVVGLELGGDDYVVKPFSPRELVARVRAVLRRPRAAAPEPADGEAPARRVIARGPLSLDIDAHVARWAGATLPLTATEFAMLRAMAERPGTVFTRDSLMTHAYDDRRYVSDRTIDSHVRRIRAKLAAAGGAPVETVHGVGYKLVVDGAADGRAIAP